MLNSADNDSFSDLISVYLKVFDLFSMLFVMDKFNSIRVASVSKEFALFS